REDILPAVEAAIRASSALSSVDLSTLSVEASIDVPGPDPRLEVIDTTFDATLACVRFRLISRAAPSLVPFVATAQLVPGRLPTFPRRARATSLNLTNLAVTATPVLVHVDRAAELHIHSENSDLRLAVKPLQRGRLGETIRVQLLGGGKILQGRVIASGQLDATF